MTLVGRSAVVTGSTRGLGWAIAEALLGEGVDVMCSARSDVGNVPAVEGRAASFVVADVGEPESVDALMRTAHEEFGRLDIVVANAGISHPGRISDLAPDAWNQTFATNVAGSFHSMRSAAKYLSRDGSGRIILMSSALATRVAPGAGAYCASKAAIEMLARVGAVEYGPERITVNCLSPGLIDEGMGRTLAGNAQVWPRYEPKLAMGRLGRADEVAAAAVFLAGDEGSYVNGHVLEINGGLDW